MLTDLKKFLFRGKVVDLAAAVVGTALFVFLKTFEKLSERRQRGETSVEEEPVPPDDIVLLTEIRDALRARA